VPVGLESKDEPGRLERKESQKKKKKNNNKEPPAAKKFALETNVIWDRKECVVKDGPKSGTVSSRNRRKQTPSHRVPIWCLCEKAKNGRQRA
jgi:hypothetical protein